MFVHRSNRTERLVDALAEVVRKPVGTPFEKEVLCVEGRGMERWLQRALTERLGVWAGAEYPFPRALLDRLMSKALDEAEADEKWSPDSLVWTVAALLGRMADTPELDAVRGYLAGDAVTRDLRLLQLAARIARVFDGYATYRPDRVRAWQSGADEPGLGGESWQPILWRAVVQQSRSVHLGTRAAKFIDTVRLQPRSSGGIPPRVLVFGASTLPPLFLEILHALSTRTEVHLFVLSPSAEYWGDVRASKRLLRREKGAPLAPDEGAMDWAKVGEGHPLLASLGDAGREFQVILERLDYTDTGDALYVDPAAAAVAAGRSPSLLESLQSDMLALERRDVAGAARPRIALDPADRSIRFHSCHSPVRELEVLHDELLALFDADPTLEARDVVVMTPDIEAYAPAIEAVFGHGGAGRPPIPFRIADRGAASSHAVVEAFLAVLRVGAGRLEANEVVDLVSMDPIRERFGIESTELEAIRDWVAALAVRWGTDAAHRALLDQPGPAVGTWRYALDRVLLGWAMEPGPDPRRDAIWGGVLPFDAELDAGTAPLLGRFLDLMDVLFDAAPVLRGHRTVADWAGVLTGLLARAIVETNDNAHEHRLVREILAKMAVGAERAGFHDRVSLPAVRERLEALFRDRRSLRGLFAGGVTFCELVPMRSIPSRVVVLVGLHDGTFPRPSSPASFDLMHRRRRLADRSPRSDDRFLFLEAILAARSHLVVTFVGQSAADKTVLPPSVVVGDLLDALESMTSASRAELERALVVEHRLAPWSPAYFAAGTRTQSYAARYAEGAQTLVTGRLPAQPFVARPLPAPATTRRSIEIDDVVRFFGNPSRAFVQRRLGVYLGAEGADVSSRAPIDLDELETWQIGDELLRRIVRGHDPEDAYETLVLRGRLVPGQLGRATFEAVRPTARALVDRARDACPGAPSSLEIDRVIEGRRLIGRLDHLYPTAQVRLQYSSLGGTGDLEAWIRHVVLAACRPGRASATIVVGRPKKDGPRGYRFRPVERPAAVLGALLDLYEEGLRRPIPLFKHASRKYAEVFSEHDPASERRALDFARGDFARRSDTRRFSGDLDDAYVSLVWEHVPSPIDDAFIEVTRAVYGPLLTHRETL